MVKHPVDERYVDLDEGGTSSLGEMNNVKTNERKKKETKQASRQVSKQD